MFHIQSGSAKAFKADFVVNGNRITMEIDTGPQLSMRNIYTPGVVEPGAPRLGGKHIRRNPLYFVDQP